MSLADFPSCPFVQNCVTCPFLKQSLAKGQGYIYWLRIIRVPFLRWQGEGKLASPEHWAGWYFNKIRVDYEGKRKNGCCLRSQVCLPWGTFISHQEDESEQWIKNRLFLNWDDSGNEGFYIRKLKKEENERDFKIPYSSVKFVPFLLELGLYNDKQQITRFSHGPVWEFLSLVGELNQFWYSGITGIFVLLFIFF